MGAARRGVEVCIAAAVVIVGALVPSAGPAGAAISPPVGRASVGTGTSKTGMAIDSLSFIDGSGRYLAFTSDQALVAGDTNGTKDAFLRDRLTDTTERVSLTSGEAQATGGVSKVCGMSDDARYVGFASAATNLAGATPQIFLRDRKNGTTEKISVNTAEVAGNGVGSTLTSRCAVSDNGRYVAFTSASTNLVAIDTNGAFDVFVRDRTAGTTERISESSTEVQANGTSNEPSISADGSLVSFTSSASNLAAGDSDTKGDIYLRNRTLGTTELVSVSSTEVVANGSGSGASSISADGTKVAFASNGSNLVAGDSNGAGDVFVRDRTLGTTVRASVTGSEAQITGTSLAPSITDDGTKVAFETSGAAAPGDPSSFYDIYVRDLAGGTTTLISGSVIGAVPDASAYDPAIADDGKTVAFESTATNLVRNDTNASPDLFFRSLVLDVYPFPSVDALVAQQFADFAGRAPTAAEATEWRARVVNGEYSTDHVINALAHSATWSTNRSPVIRLYWAFFLRKPDAGGLTYWSTKLAGGTSLDQVAASYAASSEFQNTYGALSNSAFVTLVYENVLERSPDAAGLAYWTGQLNAGSRTRGQVMAGFSESSEGVRFLRPQVDIILIYLGMLRTMPLDTTFDSWRASFAAGVAPEQFVQALRKGAAYGARV